MAFEMDPEEWVEFCLGAQARVRGAFWAEGATRAKIQTQRLRAERQAQKCRVQWVLWCDWPMGCLPRGNSLKMKPDTGRCQIGRNSECYSRVWIWSYEPVIPKPGHADFWALHTTSLSQSGWGQSLCFHQGLQAMHSHGWDHCNDDC